MFWHAVAIVTAIKLVVISRLVGSRGSSVTSKMYAMCQWLHDATFFQVKALCKVASSDYFQSCSFLSHINVMWLSPFSCKQLFVRRPVESLTAF
jgi:hypothetical protein